MMIKRTCYFMEISAITLLCFIGCSTSKHAIADKCQTKSCTREDVLKISDCALTELKYNLNLLDRIVTENDSVSEIKYLPKNPDMRGGGALLRISKKSCEIKELQQFQ